MSGLEERTVTAARRRLLVLTAAMGAGHDGVAAELARRLVSAGAEVEIVDVLRLLPFRLGPMLRWWYHWMVTRAPWLYEVIYRVFFIGKKAPSTSRSASPSAPLWAAHATSLSGAASSAARATSPSASLVNRPSASLSTWPLTALVAARLRRLVARRPPDEVVSTFHLAAQVTGRMRQRGELAAPSTVLVTDFAVHRLWLHPGNDRYLCPNPASTRHVASVTGRPVACYAPVVRPEFRRPATDQARTRSRIGAEPGDRLVLISAGSWGVGRVEETAQILARSGRYTPVILCGHNARLRSRMAGTGTGLVLGWRNDMPELMSVAYALVDNSAGLTCEEAFAAGLPVITYQPIPGHGRDGVMAMARAGVSVHAPQGAALLHALDRLHDERQRERQITRASALFASSPAENALTSAPAKPSSEPGWEVTGPK